MRGMLVYEDRPRVEWWLKLIFIGGPLLTFGLGIYFMNVDMAAAAIMFGITVFDALLFRFITPSSFQIYTDRLIIKFYGPFTKTVMLSDIKSVRPLSGTSALTYGGLKFSTTTKNVIEIERLRGMNLSISPSNRDLFIEQLNQTKKTYQY